MSKLDQLTAELQEWAKAQRLQPIDAGEVSPRDGLTAEQNDWLAEFSLRLQAAEDEEDEGPDAAQRHQMEQGEITDECETGTCDHADCHGKESWNDCVNRIMDETDALPEDTRRGAALALRTAYPAYDELTLWEGIAGLLCDLRHLCDVLSWDWSALNQGGGERYEQGVKTFGPARDAQLRRAVEDQLS